MARRQVGISCRDGQPWKKPLMVQSHPYLITALGNGGVPDYLGTYYLGTR